MTKKITEFDAATPILTDIIEFTSDPGGTAISKKSTFTNAVKIAVKPIIVALSDETTVLSAASTSVPLFSMRAPYAITLTEIRASVNIAGTGAALVTIDVHESGTTLMDTTKVTIDATEKTSTTAATTGVISDSAIADDALLEFFLDVRDTNNVATGLKIALIGVEA